MALIQLSAVQTLGEQAAVQNSNNNFLYNPGGWFPVTSGSYYSASSPDFVIRYGGDQTGIFYPGLKVKLTQTTVKYFIVVASSFDGSWTNVTLYGGTDYTLTSSPAISNMFISPAKAPVGFPLNPDKWTVILKSSSQYSQSTPTAGTWYNLGGLSFLVPVGLWDISAEANIRADYATGVVELKSALSTSNSSASDNDMMRYAIGNLYATMNFRVLKTVSLSSPTTYYLIEQNPSGNIGGMFVLGDRGTTILKARCAYL